MLYGEVTEEGVPTVALDVAGQNWTAVIDTGFNGDLELPDRLQRQLRSRWVGRVVSVLAGGQAVVEDSYLVDFPFEGRTVRVAATFTPVDEILIGTRFLRNYRLEIDFVAETVVLERRP